MSDTAATVLDAGALQRLRDLDPTGDNHLLERVLAAFDVSSTRMAGQLVVARQGGDMAAIRLVVHTLKSSSASIGALALSRICAEIEHSIRVDAVAGLGDRLDAMDRELRAVLQALGSLKKAADMKKGTPP